MMKYIFQFLLLLSSFSAIAQQQYVVDENAEQRIVSASFTSIKVSNAISLYLTQGAEESVAVSAGNKKNIDNIKTEIINGELNIYYEDKSTIHFGNKKIKAYVSFKNLAQLTATGASAVVIAGKIDVPILDIKLSGASDLQSEIHVTDFAIKCSGASTINLKGTAKNVNLECSGASDVNAYNLIAENCVVRCSGASDVNITATKEIAVIASGASNVYYKGTAEMKEKQSTGASTIAKKD
jgi:Putative auto-transporter adhesin, head GIN domain